MRDKAIKQYKKAVGTGPVKRRVLTVKNLKLDDPDKIRALFGAVAGVCGAEVDLGQGWITLTYDSSRVSLFDLRDRLQAGGYYARIATRN